MPPSLSKIQFLFRLIYYCRLIFLLKSFCPATTAQMSEGDVMGVDALIYRPKSQQNQNRFDINAEEGLNINEI